MTIDPIKIREELTAQERRASSATVGKAAATALLWFDEFGAGEAASKVVEISGRLVASATPGADAAQRYVTAAAASFADQIRQDAISRAQADLDAARASRRGRPDG